MRRPSSIKIFALVVLGMMFATSFAIQSLDVQGSSASTGPCIAPQATTWVVDSGNNRVLEFVSPIYSGMSASVVLGQPNFYTSGSSEGHDGAQISASTLSAPSQVALDNWGDIWVTDSGNNRILMYRPPFYSGMAASLVLGQSSFTVGYDQGFAHGHYYYWNTGFNPVRPSATNLRWPTAIAVDAYGDVWVVDSGNARIVEYTPVSYSNGVPQYANGESASLVLGALNFVGGTATDWKYRLFNPSDLAFDSSGNLWIVDSANDRMVEFVPPFINGMAITVAIGRPSVSNVPKDDTLDWPNRAGSGVVNASRMLNPVSVAFDADGNMWVSDASNNRILEFSPPFTTDMAASTVLGQGGTFYSSSRNNGWASGDNDQGFFSPGQLGFDNQGNLWVSDAQNNRVVMIPAPLWSGSVATMVLGQPATYQTSGSGVAQNAVNDPNGVLLTSPGQTSFKLAWVRQIDPVSRSTIFVTAPPSNGLLNHAFVALSGTPAIYVVRVSDGTVLYRSQSFNVQSSQYGLIPNQQFTLSGLGVPVAEYGDSNNIAWVTTGGRTPTPYWLFIAEVPVNQKTLPASTNMGTGNTLAISLTNIRDPSTGVLYTINPVSIAFTQDGTWLVVGGTNGMVAAFQRSCNSLSNGATVVTPIPAGGTTTPTCITIAGTVAGESAVVCVTPSTTGQGRQSFTVTVTNSGTSTYDIAQLNFILNQAFSVMGYQAPACVQNTDGSQNCQGWGASVIGQNVTWTAQPGRGGDLKPNSLQPGMTATFTVTCLTPTSVGSFIHTISVKWVGKTVPHNFPQCDSASGTVNTYVTTGS